MRLLARRAAPGPGESPVRAERRGLALGVCVACLSLASCGDSSLFVSVNDGLEAIVEVVVEPDSTAVAVGETRTFGARAVTERGDTTGVVVRWSSTDPAVAQVRRSVGDSTSVTGRRPGQAVLVARDADSGRSDSARLIVRP